MSLAQELALRDRDLAGRLPGMHAAATRLREVACAAIDAFRSAALAHDAGHLAHLEIGPVEPDDKHVDCVQVRIVRGAWEAVVVAKPRDKVTLVGPYRRGKPERPCRDLPLQGPETENGVEDLIAELIEQASAR